jgi:hypothetical protein
MDLRGIDLPLFNVFDSLNHVLVLKAFSNLVQVLSLSASTVSVSSDTDWLTWVSFVGSTDLVYVWNDDCISVWCNFYVLILIGNNFNWWSFVLRLDWINWLNWVWLHWINWLDFWVWVYWINWLNWVWLHWINWLDFWVWLDWINRLDFWVWLDWINCIYDSCCGSSPFPSVAVRTAKNLFLLAERVSSLVLAFIFQITAILGPVVSNYDTSINSPFPSVLMLVTSLLPVLALGEGSLVVASGLPDSAVLRPSTVGFDVMD